MTDPIIVIEWGAALIILFVAVWIAIDNDKNGRGT